MQRFTETQPKHTPFPVPFSTPPSIHAMPRQTFSYQREPRLHPSAGSRLSPIRVENQTGPSQLTYLYRSMRSLPSILSPSYMCVHTCTYLALRAMQAVPGWDGLTGLNNARVVVYCGQRKEASVIRSRYSHVSEPITFRNLENRHSISQRCHLILISYHHTFYVMYIKVYAMPIPFARAPIQVSCRKANPQIAHNLQLVPRPMTDAIADLHNALQAPGRSSSIDDDDPSETRASITCLLADP
ncbi:uncharacterized protein MYCFIDRAFT_178101 [Pseudocercospora fijiensis CIRAD86]|uniref:Uncharacterized protein n=1 Tax=Pseudocercospora fijiensis (strain CIRAD86) TaxID=383855 RepID=M3A4H3_PSEFD|nr:uncharacterized protein MYCFIDRAFT_178101 [Pseudocercospora fijiensis CIRAD86]EME79511.1 hypothetical protein MYCFIDRAFT_178101 [Pseudocercospora fijiensis CIRAD86]